jgi:putative Mg2+ transporter-C (MgtC) family protein
MDILADLANNDEYLVRLLVATVFGGLIGLERQSRGRSAGLRTNILVCVGSAAMIVAFQKLFLANDPGSASAIRIDPARAAAGVITGIGFLGAGTIIKSRDFVRGLTTAATIWVVSTVGITLGLGEYVIAAALTLIVLITLYALHKIDLPSDRYGTLVVTCREDGDVPNDAEMKIHGFKIKHRAVVLDKAEGLRTESISVRYREPDAPETIMGELSSIPGITRIEWI